MSRKNRPTAGPPAATELTSAAAGDPPARPADPTVGIRPDSEPVLVPTSPDARSSPGAVVDPAADADPAERASEARRRPGRHRRRRPHARAVRLAQVFGLPTIGLPAAILLLIVCQSPTPDGDTSATGRTTPPTAVTSYSMPSLNPGGLPAGYGSPSGVIPSRPPSTALRTVTDRLAMRRNRASR